MKMQTLKFAKGIYRQYCKSVKGNEETTLHQARLKMTRNAQLAVSSVRANNAGTHYRYGKLQFIVNHEGTIVWMKNHCKTPVGWKRDNQLYLKLNRELGIKEKVTSLDLVKRDAYYSIKKAFNKARFTWKKKLQTV